MTNKFIKTLIILVLKAVDGQYVGRDLKVIPSGLVNFKKNLVPLQSLMD